MAVHIASFLNEFEVLSKRQPAAIAVVDARTDRDITYKELTLMILKTARLLVSFGFKRDEVLVSLLPNSLEAILVFLATIHCGGKFAPISSQSSEREINEWIKLTKARLVIVPDSILNKNKQKLKSNGSSVENISVEKIENSKFPGGELFDGTPGGEIFIQTSGTTGAPKALVHEIDVLWSAAKSWVSLHEFINAQTRFLNYLPVSYLGGLFNLCLIPLATGGSFVITQSFSGTSLLNFWSDVERFDVNTLWLVPTILRGILTLHRRTGGRHIRSYKMIKGAFIGTAMIEGQTKRDAEIAFGFSILENFALSETTFIASEVLGKLDHDNRTVGAVLPYVDVRLREVAVSDSSPPKTANEIQVKTPFLFKGYYNSNGSIMQQVDVDGYFSTGDLAMFDENNNLVLLGRSREIIKKGGYLVTLPEVEAIASQHPNVEEASAISIPHEFYGEDLMLFVVFSDKKRGKEAIENLRVWLTEKLAKYKWPSEIKELYEMPKTASGKIQKFKLTEILDK